MFGLWRVQLAARRFKKQFGGRRVCGRGARAGGQAAEQPRIQRRQIAHAGEGRIAEGYARVAGQPLPHGFRREGMQHGNARERHCAIETLRRGRVKPNAEQAHAPDARQQRVGVEAFRGEERHIVRGGLAAKAAEQRRFVAERAVTALCKQLNAEGWAFRRLSGHKRICGQRQGHLHGLRFAGRQRYGQIVHGQNIAFAGGARAEHIAPRLHRGERRAEPDGPGRRVGQKARRRADGRASSDAD